MSQIFIETIARAIGDYRTMLRRHLKQADRHHKLAKLNLKDPTLFDSDIKLYHVAWDIVRDIDAQAKAPTGYYAYSGIAEFGKFLREYLEKYEVENGRLVHLAQKASKMMIKAIQLTALSADRLTSDIANQLNNCSDIIAKCGSDEQKDMYEGTLEQGLITQREFFTPIYSYYQEMLAPIPMAEAVFEEGDQAVG